MSKTDLLSKLALDIASCERRRRQDRGIVPYGEVYEGGRRNGLLEAFSLIAHDGARLPYSCSSADLRDYVEDIPTEKLEELAAQYGNDLGLSKELRRVIDQAVKQYYADLARDADERFARELAARAAAEAAAVAADPFHGVA